MNIKKYLTVVLMLVSLLIISTNIQAFESVVMNDNADTSQELWPQAGDDDMDEIENLESESGAEIANNDMKPEVAVESASDTVVFEDDVLQEETPSDWAFDDSSRPLHEAIVEKYPMIDIDGDGFISISEAEVYEGVLTISPIPEYSIKGTMNGIGNFRKITTLFLNNIDFSGSIPAEIGNLTELTQLTFGNTRLEGTIPPEIGNLKKLKSLVIGYDGGSFPGGTQINGSIPKEIGNLTNLTYLRLERNKLTGAIPPEIGNLTNLTDLNLADNMLTGAIPKEIGALTQLTMLFLRSNELSGNIPEEIGNLAAVRTLNLSNNLLSGEIPVGLKNLTNWAVRDSSLRGNQFTSIPQDVYDFLVDKGIDFARQEMDLKLDVMGDFAEDYTFAAYPAYEQFPSYGAPFTYTLQKPDGTSAIITPILKNLKMTLSGAELTQSGDYRLSATTGSEIGNPLAFVEYKTDFRIAKQAVNFVSLETDGIVDQETTTKLKFSVTPEPFGGLELENISLNLPDGDAGTTQIKIDRLIALGHDMYELEISGSWAEGTVVDVMLDRDMVEFSPHKRSVTLHTVATYPVNFVDSDGTILTSQWIEYQGKALPPEDPEKDGYIFAGWYGNQDLTVAWDFATPITGMTNIYAKWDVIVNETTFRIVAHDVELTVSELLHLDEAGFIALTGAYTEKIGSVTLATIDDIQVLHHTIEATPGVYTATLAMSLNENVQTDVKVTLVDDVRETPSDHDNSSNSVLGAGSAEAFLPETGVGIAAFTAIFLGVVLVLLGLLLFFVGKKSKKSNQ